MASDRYESILFDGYRGGEDLARVGFMTAGAALASYAAIDSLLDGQPEVSDFWGHLAAGMASSLGTELAFHYSGLDDRTESDVPKYAAMALAGAVGGAGIEISQMYEIPGNLDYEGLQQTLSGGAYATLGEIGQDILEE